MPLKKCKDGYKYGKSGKCYKNKKDAIKQAYAIYKSENPNMTFKQFLLGYIDKLKANQK